MIKLRIEERRPIGILMMMFFCIVGSSITGASARDTFFLTQFDKSILPLMFSLVATSENISGRIDLSNWVRKKVSLALAPVMLEPTMQKNIIINIPIGLRSSILSLIIIL